MFVVIRMRSRVCSCQKSAGVWRARRVRVGRTGGRPAMPASIFCALVSRVRSYSKLSDAPLRTSKGAFYDEEGGVATLKDWQF